MISDLRERPRVFVSVREGALNALLDSSDGGQAPVKSGCDGHTRLASRGAIQFNFAITTRISDEFCSPARRPSRSRRPRSIPATSNTVVVTLTYDATTESARGARAAQDHGIGYHTACTFPTPYCR